MRIKIITDATGSVNATLSDENPKTANAIYEALPLEANANTWGDEIYFSIPVRAEKENSKEVVEMGNLAYWPPGNAFCIFFGKTPASIGDEIRPASAVNVFGQVEGDPKIFKKVRSGAKVRVEKG
jgi:hypothetical protein